MSETDYYLILLSAFIVVTIGIVLLATNKHIKKTTGKGKLPLIIIGWTLIALTIIGTTIATLVLIDNTSGRFGLILFMILSPLFIMAGFITLLSSGIASLTEGCRKNKEGQRNKEAIVRGAFLLFLSVAVIATFIISLSVLMSTHSSEPIAFM